MVCERGREQIEKGLSVMRWNWVWESTYEGLHDFDQGDDPVLCIRRHHFCVRDGPSESEAAQSEQLDVLVVCAVALEVIS
jgi:uncharacterized protein YjlB